MANALEFYQYLHYNGREGCGQDKGIDEIR